MTDLKIIELKMELFPIYMDYYLSNSSSLLDFPVMDFERFLYKKSMQSFRLYIDEWFWKWPERFTEHQRNLCNQWISLNKL